MIVAEKKLTAAALDGDREALAELLYQHDAELRACITGRIPKHLQAAFDVDDVLQVTYLEVFLRIGQFTPRGPGSFAAWLKRAAEHNCFDAIRSLKRDKRPPRHRQREATGHDDSYTTLLDTLGGTTTSPSRYAARDEAKDMLETAIGDLPPDYERVVRMFDLEGRTAPEIALAMNRSVGAIHMLKARGHDRLVELLGRSSKFFSEGA